MPIVKGKHYSYTKAGLAAAKRAKRKKKRKAIVKKARTFWEKEVSMGYKIY